MPDICWKKLVQDIDLESLNKNQLYNTIVSFHQGIKSAIKDYNLENK